MGTYDFSCSNRSNHVIKFVEKNSNIRMVQQYDITKQLILGLLCMIVGGYNTLDIRFFS
jgi:hypothetical protein